MGEQAKQEFQCVHCGRIYRRKETEPPLQRCPRCKSDEPPIRIEKA